MADRVCSNCGKKQTANGPDVQMKEIDGKDYCCECAQNVINTKAIDALTTEQKLNKMIEFQEYLAKQSFAQTKSLNSINTMFTILLVLIIIGILFQGCSALGLI
jgi:hypothetical protein